MLPSTSIILPVHNRRAITLRCLEHLARTGVLAWAHVLVVDDGSTDGTAEAIRTAYPAVEVLVGDGHLFWTGAIVLGMRHAVARGANCCVWLNDDSHPAPGVVEHLVDQAVIQGCIAAALNCFVGSVPPIVLPPYRKTRRGLQSITDIQQATGWVAVDATRGNLVAIPRQIIEVIGYPDAAGLPHYFGDIDYTLRANRAGFRCVVDPADLVEEMEHSGNFDESWLTTRRPLRQIWARFGMKQASLYWRANWIFSRRHWGWWNGGLLFVGPYVRLSLVSLARLFLPARWLRR